MDSSGKVSKLEPTLDFKPEHFYQLLEKQNHRCALSGRELKGDGFIVAHKTPIRKGGAHQLDNLYLIINELVAVKATMTDDELLRLAEDIVSTLKN